MNNDSVKRTVLVALVICVVCSILVSTSVVLLRPRQDENRRIDQLKSILVAAGLYTRDSEVIGIYQERIRRFTINLASGSEAEGELKAAGLQPESYDLKRAMLKAEHSEAIPPDEDLADLKRRPRWVNIYLVLGAEQVERVILPVFGKGLWSTMFGFMALDAELNTVLGFTFYDHGETPGLGGEVDNPRWKALWPGKALRDDSGAYRLEVIKGKVDENKPEQRRHAVDGLSGSTLTTRGVDHLLRYWLDSSGYGPFFRRFLSGEFK